MNKPWMEGRTSAHFERSSPKWKYVANVVATPWFREISHRFAQVSGAFSGGHHHTFVSLFRRAGDNHFITENRRFQAETLTRPARLSHPAHASSTVIERFTLQRTNTSGCDNEPRRRALSIDALPLFKRACPKMANPSAENGHGCRHAALAGLTTLQLAAVRSLRCAPGRGAQVGAPRRLGKMRLYLQSLNVCVLARGLGECECVA